MGTCAENYKNLPCRIFMGINGLKVDLAAIHVHALAKFHNHSATVCKIWIFFLVVVGLGTDRQTESDPYEPTVHGHNHDKKNIPILQMIAEKS